MIDAYLEIRGFCIHVKTERDGFTEEDAGRMLDRIQRAIEEDPRCEMIVSKPLGETGFMHRIIQFDIKE